MASHRLGVTDFVHIGLVVEDLGETVQFLWLRGFDCGEPGVFSGACIDQIICLDDVTVETSPGGSDMFDGVRFLSPSTGAHEPAPAANRRGLRHVGFKVDDAELAERLGGAPRRPAQPPLAHPPATGPGQVTSPDHQEVTDR